MRKTKLFITGMGGMVGRALATYALEENYLIGGTIHENLPYELKVLGNKGLLKNYFIDLKKIDETEKVILDFKPNAVVHLAGKALGQLDNQIFNPQVYKENIIIFKNILSAVKKLTNLPRFILSSGCLIYNKFTSPDFVTEIPTHDLPKVDSKKEPYRASRIDQEKLLLKEGDLDYIITRPTQITGPGKIPGVVEWYIAGEISKILSGKSKIITVKNKLAEIDLLDVRDVARAHLILIDKGLKGEIYHISSGSPTTVEQVAKVFLEIVGLNPITFPIESTHTEKAYFRFSPNKLKKLGWSPEYSLKDALIRYWQYFKNQNTKISYNL